VKILIADDSRTNVALLSNALHKLGHEVVAASSGREAVALFQLQRPDLLILDVMMENMDGFECARQIRALDSDDWIPIIFLSASVDDASIAKGIDAGGDDYLAKPFSEITLEAKIKAMQRISDMRQKLFETTQKLYLLSSTDALTDVYNRAQFDRSVKEIVATADRYHNQLALLFIDLDNFKNVNDTFGHHIGDLLLTEVAARLKRCVRSVDFVARLGGDEFAVVLSEIKNIEEAAATAKNILAALDADYNLDNHYIRNGASIGIACYPAMAGSVEDLILNADIAMYHAKASGRNNFQYYTQELNQRYRQQINLEHSLKFAIERHEMFLTYQPIFELQSRNLAGVEVLINWDHPKFGVVSPSIFIPIAENTSLINEIGSWVLETACTELSQFPIRTFKKFRFAINISPRQILQEDFYQHIIEILTAKALPPNFLELELTETSVMTYTNPNFQDVLRKLHKAGVSISIDDFGTGYSSLIRLKHLPINALKIEKLFVQDAATNSNGSIIVNCLIALGKNLGMTVIAEGIETQEQLDFLIAKGCPQGQGYYLSKPLTADKLAVFFKNMQVKQP